MGDTDINDASTQGRVYWGIYMRIMDTSPNEEAKLPHVNAANDVVLC